MKVVTLGNMANDGLATTLALRKVNVDAHIYVNYIDFACAHPEWEYGDFGRNMSFNGKENEVDPYNLANSIIEDTLVRPNWIRTLPLARLSYLMLDFTTSDGSNIGTASIHHQTVDYVYSESISTPQMMFTPTIVYDAVRNVIKKFDVAHAHIPYSTFLQYMKIPYIIYEAGWIRGIDAMKNPYTNYLEQSYEISNKIIYTNPDMIHIINKYPKIKDKAIFIPFAIDTQHYKPQNVVDIRQQIASNEDEFVILGMARQMKGLKGNPKMLSAFIRFNKKHPNSRLVLSRWGERDDIELMENTVKQMNLEDKVTWTQFLPKQKLIYLYNAVDMACDQFEIGCWGTAYPEAMSSGCPTLVYYDEKDIDREFTSRPPIRSVKSATEIYEEMEKIYSNTNIDYLKYECREWVEETHGMKDVGERHKAVCEEVLADTHL